MLVTKLEELGFTPDQAKIYLAVLELGGCYVSAIAKKAGIHRVNCYKILDELVSRGLVSSFLKNNIKYYAVESPRIIVEKQEERLGQARKILPELLSITNAMAYKPKVQYYEGREGIKNIFEDTLHAEGEMVGYTNLRDVPLIVSEEYLRSYAKRKIERKVKTRMLSPLFKPALKYLDKYYPKDFDRNLVEIFFINPREFPFDYEITIYGSKVALISLNSAELMGMIIESPLYAKTQKSIFNLAWLGATSFVAK